MPAFLIRIVEKSYRKGRGFIILARYGFPARGMRVIAITGTNGKSTTSAYMNEILKAAGYKTAVLNTVFYEIDGKRTANTTHFTVDRQSIVQSLFARARKAGVDFVVLEVTSHALDQDRIIGVPVEIAIITNLTQDHLDYHKTMENYAAAKALLLRKYGAKYAVLNRDDKWYEYFLSQSKATVYSYGKSKLAELEISSVKQTANMSSATFSFSDKKLAAKTALIGEYNLYNAAGASEAALLLGIDEKSIEKGIANLSSLSGRMEEIREGQSFRVFVDFAITPDALEKALVSLKEISKGKVAVVFGATGDRDKGKRPDMGRVAAENADRIFLTDDETYSEKPEVIRNAVLRGIKAAGGEKKTQVIPDRKEAIKKAFAASKTGDSVLITGLGHEDSRNMGGKLVPWSDQAIARETLDKS